MENWAGTTTTGSLGAVVTWSWTPPEDEPPAGVPARPRPAPAAPPATAMALA